MASDWPVLSLRAAGVQLLDCEHRTPPPAEAGYPYVAIPQVKDGRLDLSDARLISHEHLIEWTRKASPQQWDVILSRRCNPGETAVVPSGLQCALGQNLVLLRADGKGVLPEFLRWLVRSPDWWEQVQTFINVGAVFDSLKCADIPNFRLPVPLLADQRAIAHILGTLDDKIELNRRMNETLEAMAQALFRSWFVDFDPVRAKAEGRDPDLPKEIADLFPDRFEDSELGKIPAGWGSGTLGQYASLNPETWSMETRPEVIEYVDLANTKWGRIESTDRHTREDAPSRAQRVLRPGDTIIGTVRPGNGSYAYIAEEGLTGSTGFAVLRPLTTAHRELVYLASSTLENIERLSHLADGAAYPAVRPDVVLATRIANAPKPVIEQLADSINPAFGKIAWNDRESRTLAALRDALLPKLISGELRVQDARWFVDGVDTVDEVDSGGA